MNGSCNFHYTVAPSLYFLRGKFNPEILRGSPEQGRQKREGWVKSAVFLSLSVNISKTVADAAKVKLMWELGSHIYGLFIHTKIDDLG